MKSTKQEFISGTQIKISLFVKLCQKYLKKIINLTNIHAKLNNNTDNKDVLYGELKHIVERFSSSISNKNLMNSFFETSNLIDDFDDDDLLSKNNNSALIEVVKKLENHIRVLNEKNDKNKKFEVIVKNNSKVDIEEFKKLKKNYQEIKVNFEETQRTISLQKQLNKDLENKCQLYEEENTNFVFKMKNLKEKNQKYNVLKEKLIKYKNDLKHKDSIIEYLEKAMKSGKNGIMKVIK